MVLPKENEKDLRDIPREVKKDLNFVLIEHIDQALTAAFGRSRKKT